MSNLQQFTPFKKPPESYQDTVMTLHKYNAIKAVLARLSKIKRFKKHQGIAFFKELELEGITEDQYYEYYHLSTMEGRY